MLGSVQVAQSVLDKNKWAAAQMGLQAAAKLLGNIVRCNNSNAAFRYVKCSNAAIQRKVLDTSAVDVLKCAGFRMSGSALTNEWSLVFPEHAELEKARALAARCAVLHMSRSTCRSRRVCYSVASAMSASTSILH